MKQKNTLTEMEKKAKQIKKIRFIRNTILANTCYHDKEMENQINIANKMGNLTTEEHEAVMQSWELCNKLGKELIKELKEYAKQKKN